MGAIASHENGIKIGASCTDLSFLFFPFHILINKNATRQPTKYQEMKLRGVISRF